MKATAFGSLCPRGLPTAIVLAVMVAVTGCGGRDDDAGQSATALEIAPGSTCSLDGMLLADFPGPKGQIRYADDPEVHWYCDTMELVSALVKPEQVRSVRGAWVQDMARADWEVPRGHWIDARKAFYVVGSRRHGSMGPTVATFSEEVAAGSFAEEYGGQVLRLEQIRPDMVDLSGGALHDKRM